MSAPKPHRPFVAADVPMRGFWLRLRLIWRERIAQLGLARLTHVLLRPGHRDRFALVPRHARRKRRAPLDLHDHVSFAVAAWQRELERSPTDFLWRRLPGLLDSVRETIEIMQGIWTNATLTPLERPRAMADRRFLTEDEAARLEAQAARLESLSPLNVLSRGYSLTRKEADQAVVRSADQVRPGERLLTTVQHGTIVSRVEEAS